MKKTLFVIGALFVLATLFAQNNSIKVNGLEISYCYMSPFSLILQLKKSNLSVQTLQAI